MGKPELPPKVKCEDCKHLRRNLNQPAGLALCERFNGYNWPLVERWCLEFKAVQGDD